MRTHSTMENAITQLQEAFKIEGRLEDPMVQSSASSQEPPAIPFLKKRILFFSLKSPEQSIHQSFFIVLYYCSTNTWILPNVNPPFQLPPEDRAKLELFPVKYNGQHQDYLFEGKLISSRLSNKLHSYRFSHQEYFSKIPPAR